MDVSRKGDESLEAIIAQAREDEEARQAFLNRKKYELKLVKKFDKPKINTSEECWFMIDASWLNRWSEFVNDPDNEDPPGPMSTKDLLCDAATLNASSSSSAAGDQPPVKPVFTKGPGLKVPIPGLQPRIDYRAVPPMVYFILVELYGRDSAPDICRYSVDIYKPEVPVDRLVNIKLKAVMDAKIQVNRVRPKWMKWEHKFDDDEDDKQPICCCGLTKEHVEAFIYWAIRCWSRKSAGRENIKYSQYKPLTDTSEMDNSVRNMQSGHGGNGGYSGGWWPGSWSSHGNTLDSSTHSNKSTGSSHGGITELTSTRNTMHSRYTRGGMRVQEEQEKSKIQEEVDDDEIEYSDSDSDEEIEFGVAPADTNYERGTWLRTVVSSSGRS